VHYANVADVLRDKVALDIESVDRVYLNGYIKDLQVPGSVVLFIRNQKDWPLPSPQMLYNMTDDFHKAVERFAVQQGLEIVTFEKDDNKERKRWLTRRWPAVSRKRASS